MESPITLDIESACSCDLTLRIGNGYFQCQFLQRPGVGLSYTLPCSCDVSFWIEETSKPYGHILKAMKIHDYKSEVCIYFLDRRGKVIQIPYIFLSTTEKQ